MIASRADPKRLSDFITPVLLEGSIPISARADRLRAFKAWLEARGLRVAPTRVARYEKSLRLFADKPILSHKEQDRYVFTVREADELLWVFDGLQFGVPQGALELLEKSIGGNEFAREDRRSLARNSLFELRIASYFLQAGFTVDLSNTADLIVHLNKGVVYVECKRLESNKKVQARASEAAKQLRYRLRESGSKLRYGLAVFDVAQVIHPYQGLAIGKCRFQIRDVLRAELRCFAEQFNIQQQFVWEKRVLSVWLQVMAPSVQLAESEAATRFSSLHLPLVGSTGPKARIFEELKRAFEIAG